MGYIKINNFIEMLDKSQTFITVVDKMSVHSLVLYMYGMAICVCSFEFNTGGSRTPRLCCNVKHSSDPTPYRTLWFVEEVVIFQVCVSLL